MCDFPLHFSKGGQMHKFKGKSTKYERMYHHEKNDTKIYFINC